MHDQRLVSFFIITIIIAGRTFGFVFGFVRVFFSLLVLACFANNINSNTYKQLQFCLVEWHWEPFLPYEFYVCGKIENKINVPHQKQLKAAFFFRLMPAIGNLGFSFISFSSAHAKIISNHL